MDASETQESLGPHHLIENDTKKKKLLLEQPQWWGVNFLAFLSL